MMKAISDKEYAPLPSTVSPLIKEIIKSLLEKNPNDRPDAQALIEKDEIKRFI
jgi:serine/threonine protein kinase